MRENLGLRERKRGGKVEVIKIDFPFFFFFSLLFFMSFFVFDGLRKKTKLRWPFFISFLRRLECVSVVILSLVLPSRSSIGGVLFHVLEYGGKECHVLGGETSMY